MEKIAIASDHGGFELKEILIGYLFTKELEVIDCGTDSSESVDYPEYAEKVARMVATGEVDRGILICGTGIGMSIAANRIKGVRCTLCTSVHMAEASRKHNNSNILAMGGRTTEAIDALDIMEAWLKTEFDDGRHQRRIDKIDEIRPE